jgi:hypothetical protein
MYGSNQEVVLERESHIWVDVLLGRSPGVLLLRKLLDPALLLEIRDRRHFSLCPGKSYGFEAGFPSAFLDLM